MRPLRAHLLRPRPLAGGSRAAFTLVELLVSIGIIAFVLSATIVAVGPMFRTTGVSGAARSLRSAIDGARIRAIQQGRQVRFQAQLVRGSVTDTWEVTSNANDLSPKWDKLPDFVAIATNVESGSRGDDGIGGSYVGTDESTVADMVSITFGPDGAVVRAFAGKRSGSTFTPVKSEDTASGLMPPFAVRLTNLREAAAATARRWIAVYSLTGGLRTFETQ